jgi:NAD(P)-dependent dehydrogenase (short-subunit alcohol dehydrogenase family)
MGLPQTAGGASIVVTDSCGGLRGAPLPSAYRASKLAATGLIAVASPESAVRGIRINDLRPMCVRTRCKSGS